MNVYVFMRRKDNLYLRRRLCGERDRERRLLLWGERERFRRWPYKGKEKGIKGNKRVNIFLSYFGGITRASLQRARKEVGPNICVIWFLKYYKL